MKKIDKENLRTICSGNVRLRPIHESDTEHIIQWRNSEFVKSNFVFREPLTVKMHTDWLHKIVFAGNAIQYMIEIADAHLPIGTIYIRDIDLKNESGEFGIFIGESEYISKGYGTCATKVFLSFCFSLGFHRIFLRVFEDNIRAQQCYRKTGFAYEGTAKDMVCIDGKRFNMVFMSIINK